jgi:prevent-host-death family protein
MRTASVRDAQHHLSRLLAEVEKGEEIVLTRRGQQVGKLVPVRPPEDPFEVEVDWAQSIRERNENLRSLPQLQRNIVVEMREVERY